MIGAAAVLAVWRASLSAVLSAAVTPRIAFSSVVATRGGGRACFVGLAGLGVAVTVDGTLQCSGAGVVQDGQELGDLLDLDVLLTTGALVSIIPIVPTIGAAAVLAVWRVSLSAVLSAAVTSRIAFSSVVATRGGGRACFVGLAGLGVAVTVNGTLHGSGAGVV